MHGECFRIWTDLVWGAKWAHDFSSSVITPQTLSVLKITTGFKYIDWVAAYDARAFTRIWSCMGSNLKLSEAICFFCHSFWQSSFWHPSWYFFSFYFFWQMSLWLFLLIWILRFLWMVNYLLIGWFILSWVI